MAKLPDNKLPDKMSTDKMSTDKASPEKIIVSISNSVKLADDVQLVGFLFSRSGKLLQQIPIRKNTLAFTAVDSNPRQFKIFIAPVPADQQNQITSPTDLERLKPFEVVLNTLRDGSFEAVTIPDIISKYWFRKTCQVRGKVIKNFQLQDLNQYRGICHARVHICEIDRIRLWIHRIPDDIILRIPELVENPELPIPVPDPGPLFDRSIVELNPQPLPPKLSANLRVPFENIFAASNDKAPTALATQQTLAASQTAIMQAVDVKDLLITKNADAIRKAVIDNYSLFHPYFCLIPWLWPYFYRCDEIKVAYTDLNGAFDVKFSYWDYGDKPDLYFWVEVLIDGEWTTVYKPTIPCHTYWDFACGSEVTIRVTDPRVRWECNDVLDGDIVWVKTIGSAASVHHIQQTDLNSTVQGKAFNRIGLSDVSVWASPNNTGDFRRPFGGGLSFIVQFGSGLPANGMYYYRWSYRKIRNADLSLTGLTALSSLHAGQTLSKGYTFEYFDIFSHKHIGSDAFKLGPYSKNGQDDLYIIPPTSPANAPVNASQLSPLWNQNTHTVNFDSSKFSDGLYEFILELFDFSGNKLSTIPNQIFQIPHYNSFVPSINATSDYLVANGPANASAYRMLARLDNSACVADIYKIKVNGVEATSDCCGFVPYPPGAALEISYLAYHPQNFALFNFTVQKGTCNDNTQSGLTNASGMVIGDAGLYSRNNSSVYRHSFTPAQLLGICLAEGKAAFAEHLSITALATNGSNQLNHLNDSGLAAFAIEPA